MNFAQLNRLMACVVVTALMISLTESTWAQRTEALPPADSQAEIELLPGFSAKLLAHEPEVIDPVEVAFDDAGRMWVVEMRDYPFRIDGEPAGRIRVLTDEDGDGRYDSATTFADGLDMPNGLAFWKNGLVATVAGRLIYLVDSDGDGRSDQTQVWLQGFKEENEQLRANHPRLGPDGYWYIASGLRGGQVSLGPDLQGQSQSPPLEMGTRDVRFDPREKTIELVTGPAQFGLTFDARGNRLFCSNRKPGTQIVFEQADLAGNPLSGLVPSVVDVIPSGEQSQVFPLVDAWTTSHLHSGQFTAACGVFARNLPAAAKQADTTGLRTEVYACEPTGSLVRRQLSHWSGAKLVPADNSITANREWLASRDSWFRPVNVTLAPDGEIVVVDMHRAVIEHPQFMPAELKNRPDGRLGTESGRIYWVGETEGLTKLLGELRASPLGSRSTSELVALVADANPWLSGTAARLLLEREATEAVAKLMQQATSEHVPTLGRIASVRLASNLTRSFPDGTQELFSASEPSLAITALRIARQYPQALVQHRERVLELTKASHAMDAGLAHDLLLSLGTLPAGDELQIPATSLSLLVAQAVERRDALLLTALGSAFRNQPRNFLYALLAALDKQPAIDQGQLASEELDLFADAARQLTAAAIKQEPQWNEVPTVAVSALGDATAGQALRLAALACLSELNTSRGKFAALERGEIWQQILGMVQNTDLSTTERLAAIRLLGRSPRAEDSEFLAQYARANTVPQLTTGLLRAWAVSGGKDCFEYLADNLAAASPPIQRTMLELLAGKPAGLELLAQRLQSGELTARQIGAVELKKVAGRAQGETRSALEGFLAEITNSNRAQVVEQYKACLTLPGDMQRGVEIFRKHCASCHRIGDVGIEIGPNIADSRTKQPLELLTSILDPNLAIDNNYFRFVIQTDDGRVLDGLIAEETADTIVLRGQDDKREIIPREEILDMKATGVSLMPEGIEAQIDHAAMADLLAFIKGWRYLDGSVPAEGFTSVETPAP